MATYAGRGEFDAPRESLSTALRRLSRGGALRITGIERTIGTPNRYASREVLLNPVDEAGHRGLECLEWRRCRYVLRPGRRGPVTRHARFSSAR